MRDKIPNRAGKLVPAGANYPQDFVICPQHIIYPQWELS